jgi:hypothetical protein
MTPWYFPVQALSMPFLEGIGVLPVELSLL